MIEEQRSAGAGGCCVFQRGCLRESYDLARAAVMGAHGVLLPAVQGFLLLSHVLCLACCGQTEACLVSCAESKGCLVCYAVSVLCCVVLCCQGLSSVLCCEASACVVLSAKRATQGASRK